MKESFILNFNILKEVNLSVEEFIFLVNLYNKKDNENIIVSIEKLEEHKFIKIINTSDTERIIILRSKSIDLLEFLMTDIDISFNTKKKIIKKSKRVINQEIDDRIGEYRSKWKGLKAGSMGSPKACKQKLTRWMKENPTYSFDDILKAVDLYLQEFHVNTTFLQNAEYFIFKQNTNKEESSRLSAYIDEIGIGETKDWTSQIN
jgi:hypothetical protein